LIIQPGGILDGQCHMLSSAVEGQEATIAIPVRPGVEV
jgi:hypothetical protein